MSRAIKPMLLNKPRGAPRVGGAPGNQNAVKHGLYTRAAIEERKQLRTLMRDARKLMHSIA